MADDIATLDKGVTRCNRTACQVALSASDRFWNYRTNAYYCPTCARRINEANPGLCVRVMDTGIRPWVNYHG